MSPDLKKIFFLLLTAMVIVFSGGLLPAQEKYSFFQIRTDLLARLPAAEARQKILPPLFAGIRKNLKNGGVAPDVPLIAFYGKNLITEKNAEKSFFVLYFHRLKTAQLRYLLKYGLLHPDWKYREQDGVFHIEASSLKFVLFQHKNADGFFAAPAYGIQAQAGAELLLKKINFNSANAVSGTFYFPANAVLHPAMQAVRTAKFAVTGGKNTKGETVLRALIELTGSTPEQTKKIADDMSSFFAGIYANAEKEAAKTNRKLTAEDRNALYCFFKSEKAYLFVTFNEEWATTFLTLFSENLR